MGRVVRDVGFDHDLFAGRDERTLPERWLLRIGVERVHGVALGGDEYQVVRAVAWNVDMMSIERLCVHGAVDGVKKFVLQVRNIRNRQRLFERKPSCSSDVEVLSRIIEAGRADDGHRFAGPLDDVTDHLPRRHMVAHVQGTKQNRHFHGCGCGDGAASPLLVDVDVDVRAWDDIPHRDTLHTSLDGGHDHRNADLGQRLHGNRRRLRAHEPAALLFRPDVIALDQQR